MDKRKPPRVTPTPPAEKPAGAKENFNSSYIPQPDKIVDTAMGYTRLIDAVRRRDLALVKKFLRGQASPHKPDLAGLTPLHHAAAFGFTGAVDALLEQGAHLNARDKKGQTPLFHARHAPQPLQMLSHLAAAGANAGLRDEQDRLPLHYAAESADAGYAAALLAVTPQPDAPDKKGYSPLLLACRYSDLSVLRALLTRPVSLLSQTADGNTCLHLAAERSDPAVFNFLLQTEAAKLTGAVNLSGQSPLHLAVASKDRSRIRALIGAGADVNLRDLTGITPLHVAIGTGVTALVALLIDEGADIAQAQKNVAVPPLAQALRNFPQSGMVELLLLNGASVTQCDKAGATPLMLAAKLGHAEFLRQLLAAGADPAPHDHSNNNVLHYCDKAVPADLIDAFIRGGAALNLQENVNKKTPLAGAVQEGKSLLARLLLEAGANPNTPDSYNSSPLHMAVRFDHPDIMHALLEKGASVNGAEKTTPLHLACQLKLVAQVLQLVAHGAAIDAQDLWGKTPLFVAVKSDASIVIAETLLKAGANPLIMNTSGESAYMLAEKDHKAELVALFDRHLKDNPPKPKIKPPGIPGL